MIIEKNALGRPTNDKLILSKDDILKKALKILDTQGENGLSFRKLAKEFGVTAMALKHHVGSRQDMIKSLVKHVYKSVNISYEPEDSKLIIQELLSNYCQRVFKHPNVCRLLLTDHSLINEELIDLTNTVRKHSKLLAQNESEGVLFADIVIDYTHGFALAAASQNDKTDMGVLTIDDFNKGLVWLLSKI